MAKRGRKAQSAPFTKVYATWPRLLHEAHVNATEWAVLVALAQHPQRNGLFSRPVADYGAAQDGIATATGCSKQQVCNALDALTRKTFTAANGKQTPILTRKVSAHRGRCAVYKCNLPEWPERESDHEGGSESDHNDTDAAPPETEESITEQLSNNKEMDNQSMASWITNPLPHLELGGDGKDHPSPPWFR